MVDRRRLLWLPTGLESGTTAFPSIRRVNENYFTHSFFSVADGVPAAFCCRQLSRLFSDQ
jgi:hypothetical protein